MLGTVDLEANDIDGTGFLIYRKSDKDFTVLSRGVHTQAVL